MKSRINSVIELYDDIILHIQLRREIFTFSENLGSTSSKTNSVLKEQFQGLYKEQELEQGCKLAHKNEQMLDTSARRS